MVVTNISMIRRGKVRFIITVFLVPILVLSQLIAVADSTLSLNTYYYDIHPGLSIIKPSVDYKNSLSLDTTINARLTVDRVKTEPVDAVSSASQTMGVTISKTDIRQEYLVGASHTMGNWIVGAGILASLEKDYKSYSPSILITKDFNLRNTTLGLGYSHNFDSVHGQYMSQEESKDVDNISLSLTQVLSTTTLLQLSYTDQINTGFLGTGNRKLVLENGLEYDEYLPSSRKRQAFGIRIAQWFNLFNDSENVYLRDKDTTVHFGYRYYTDDWMLDSNTFELTAHQTLSTNIKMKAEYRYYDQSEVYFAKDIYTGSEKYLTTANSLSAFTSDLWGVSLIYTPVKFDKYRLLIGFEKYNQSSGLTGSAIRASIKGNY